MPNLYITVWLMQLKSAVTAAIVDVYPSSAEADFVPIVAVSTAVKRDQQGGINANASELQEITVPSHRADIVLATTCFAAIRQKSCVYLPQLKRCQPSASALGLPSALGLLPPFHKAKRIAIWTILPRYPPQAANCKRS